jgi:hypothetical protein
MAQRFAASPSILTFMAESPNYGQLSSTSAMERAKNKAADLFGNARIHGAGIKGRANKEVAKHRGAAAVAQGRADGYAAMMGGLADGVSSVVGGVARRPSGSMPETSLDGYEYGEYGNLPGEYDGDGASGYIFPSTSSWMTGG